MNFTKPFLCLLVLLLGNPLYAAEVIDKGNVHKPYIKGKPAFKLVFAPDFVGCDVPRRFLVEIEFVRDFVKTKLEFESEFVKLLGERDITSGVTETAAVLPVGQKRKLRRYYFQTVKRSKMTEVRLSDNTGTVVAPIVIWDYNDLRQFRTVSDTELPRRYPVGGSLPYVKPRQVLPKRPKGYKTEPVKMLRFVSGRAEFFDSFNMRDFTFEGFWCITPDCSLVMRKNTGDIDPVHGDKVYEVAGDGFYPYKMTMAMPGEVNSYYLISPIDDRKIPDNDWAAGDYNGKYMDDGVNGIELEDGKQHYYISQYVVMRGLQAYDMVKQASELYESTGDKHYARLTLIGLCRIGLEHNYLSTLLNHRRTHINKYKDHTLVEVAAKPAMMGNCGFMFDGIWTTQSMKDVIQAYDKVFSGITYDKELFSFLQSKNLPIHNTDQLKRFIEENVFLTYIQTMLDGSQQYNFPGTQLTFLEMIQILDYPTDEFMDVVCEGDGNYLVNGLITPLFTAGYYRDGIKAESLGGYNRGGISSLYSIYDSISTLLDNSTQEFPSDKYARPADNKKFLTALESQIQHATTPYTVISLGDGGHMVGYRRYYDNGIEKKESNSQNFFGDENADIFNEIYKKFPSPKLAWAMINSSNWKLPVKYPYTLDQIKAEAIKLPANWRQKATTLSGPGVSILRSGHGENERTVYTHYGHTYGHAQDGTMGLFIDAFKGRLVTNWGYPIGWDKWYCCWMPQNTGRHFPVSKAKDRYFIRTVLEGINELTIDSGNFHITDNRADLVYDKGLFAETLKLKTTDKRYEVLDDGWQRRINFLVDVSDDEFYVIDFYRMIGGKDHWRTFHTLDGNVETKGLTLKKQAKGTVAGENVAYNDLDWVNKHANQHDSYSNLMSSLGFVRLTNVERASTDNKPFEVTWNVAESNGLKLRLTSLNPGDVEIVLADAKEPSNANPMVRRMLLWHHNGDDGLQSQVLNIFEGYRKVPVVVSAKRLKVEGSDERDFAPIGLEVNLANRTDYIIISASKGNKQMKLPNGQMMKLDGRIGCVSLDKNGTTLSMNLISGENLYLDSQKLSMPKDCYEANIVSADYEDWSFTLSPSLNNPEQLVGKTLHVNRGGIKIPLEIRSAKENDRGQTCVTVNCDPLLYTFKCRKIEDGRLVYKDYKKWAKWDYGRDETQLSRYRYYHGTSLFSKSGKKYTLDTLGKGQVKLMPSPEIDSGSLKIEFKLGEMINVYDYAQGDKVEVHFEVSLK